MKSEITLEYILPGKATEISSYFSDFVLFGKHHPYMIQTVKIAPTTSTNTFRVYESLKLWGFIPMKPMYDVNIIVVEAYKHIQYQSEISKGIFLHIDYTFVEYTSSNTVKVIETMHLIGYPIINPIFIGLLKKTRKLLIESIRKELENK
jgi:hypothetical protein